MFGLSMLNPWKWGTIGLSIALVLALGWGARVDSLRASWSDKYTKLDNEAKVVLVAVRLATGNRDLKWSAVPEQISELSNSNARLKDTIDSNNQRITKMEEETLLLKAKGDEFRAQLVVAQEKRKAVLDRLATMSITPSDTTDSAAMLLQVEEALELAYGSDL